jgi:hypothetical protein
LSTTHLGATHNTPCIFLGHSLPGLAVSLAPPSGTHSLLCSPLSSAHSKPPRPQGLKATRSSLTRSLPLCLPTAPHSLQATHNITRPHTANPHLSLSPVTGQHPLPAYLSRKSPWFRLFRPPDCRESKVTGISITNAAVSTCSARPDTFPFTTPPCRISCAADIPVLPSLLRTTYLTYLPPSLPPEETTPYYSIPPYLFIYLSISLSRSSSPRLLTPKPQETPKRCTSHHKEPRTHL